MAARYRILVVDDEEDFCYFVKNNLEDTGEFDVLTANNGEQGIAIAKEASPDLILLDIIMPGLSGTEVAENLLQDPQTRQIPIIFLTAVVTKEELGPQTLREIGGNNFIAKVAETPELVGAIKEVLRR
ncbi:MAG: response regulator [Candidatus Nealsonbacteria bacterium]|nr:MAG: response regulator [Candidatus Nealsonbacteria bacterium]